MKKKISVLLTQEINGDNVKTAVDVLTETSDKDVKKMFLDVFEGLKKCGMLSYKDLQEHE